MYLVTFFFQVGRDGWSETWPNTSTSDDDVIKEAQDLLNQRVNLLGSGASLTYMRISDPAQKRDLIFQRKGNIPLPISGKGGAAAQASAAVNVKLFTTNNKEWATRMFRGVPTTAFDSGAVNGLNQGDQWYTSLLNFVAKLKQASTHWVLRKKDGSTYRWKDYSEQRATTKKAGRPFGSRRGRKFAHRVHH